MDFRVKVDRVKAGGLPCDRELSPAEITEILQADPPTAFRAAGPTALEARLDRVNDRDIIFEGHADLALVAECRRCLALVEVSVPMRFTLDLVDKDKVADLFPGAQGDDDGAGEVGGSFGPDDANQILYSGREVDLGPVIREQILLAVPLDAICKPDCKGLCQVCGQNLNKGECSCDRHVPDPRWAGLKDIKI